MDIALRIKSFYAPGTDSHISKALKKKKGGPNVSVFIFFFYQAKVY